MAGKIIIAGTHSGVGKTTVAIGVMRALARRGLKVQPFKVGPDYIDPGYHRLACGAPSRNLDVWLTSEETVARIFDRAAGEADVAVVEGVMGLFDGSFEDGSGSTAHVAKVIGAPVILVVDARSMAQSASAIIYGFRTLDPHVNVAGVIFNNVGSARHTDILRRAAERVGIPVIGYLKKADIHLSDRHLGLVPAIERRSELDESIDKIGDLAEELDLDRLLEIAGYILDTMSARKREVGEGSKSVSIGVAYDEAFNFYYEDALELLAEKARLEFFSPLNDVTPPDVDGFYFGGGFPEIFAERLAENEAMRRGLRERIAAGVPTYAECGGLIYMGGEVADFDTKRFPMVGALDIDCRMTRKLKLGYTSVETLANTPLAPERVSLRAHEFHYSEVERANEPSRAYLKSKDGQFEGYVKGNLVASYAHLHFCASEGLVERFVAACEENMSS